MNIAIVNSRKPRHVSCDEPWLRVTMALGYAIARAGHTLCGSAGTLGYDAALFGAAMGGGEILALAEPGAQGFVAACLPAGAEPNRVTIRTIAAQKQRGLARDVAVMDAADVVIAVAVRSGGHFDALLHARWHAGKPLQVVAPLGEGPGWRGTRKLMEAGVPQVAEELWRIAQEIMDAHGVVRHNEPDWTTSFLSWRDAPLAQATLAHFTRASNGPWPGQTYAQYLEDLWAGGLRGRRDAPAVLWRILQMSRLIANGQLIRGGFPVVSFTAVSPDRLKELHRYRSHLVRWDFEPWGIVFDRDWLLQRGARPVHYLSNIAFASLVPEQQPWFQKHEPPECDYTIEEEWRVRGDLDFSDAPQDAVRLVLGA